MISKDQLKNLNEDNSLHLYQKEKEYLIKLFLNYYYKDYEDAVFKGGTALRLIYGLNRFSEDLDFNITNPQIFKKEIKSTLKYFDKIGIENFFIKEELFESSYTSTIGFHGPLYDGSKKTRNKIRIDAGYRDKVLNGSRWKIINSEYPETKSKILVNTMDIKEILCEKIRALFSRDKGRDLYDVWFLLNSGVKLDINLLKQKIDLNQINESNLISSERYENDLKYLVNRVIPYKQVRKEVLSKLYKLKDR
ncbi:MAG: nucleotidyl transferase AbiEii/AbiGii toxin family protein [Candidatus Woesearchaeota archaeon]